MSLRSIFISLVLTLSALTTRGQEEEAMPGESTAKKADTLSDQRDLPDLFKQLVGNKKPRENKTKSSIALLPALGYNPSYGFLFGANIVKTSYKGDPAHTKLSVAQLDVSYTTKGLLIARFRHNIFRDHNLWNLQGNWQYNRGYVVDYGLGDTARRDPPVPYPIRYNYFKLSEKVYRKIGKNIYAGMGVSFDMRNSIDDKVLDSPSLTPHYKYSRKYGFDPDKYNVNGLMFILQYNTRDHPNNAYKGIYADVNFRFNPTWLGSTERSGQLYTEFRKYFSLSAKPGDSPLRHGTMDPSCYGAICPTWNFQARAMTLTCGADAVIRWEGSGDRTMCMGKPNCVSALRETVCWAVWCS